MLIITTISATKANEILQQGGLNWILFCGDDFDDDLLEEWAGYAPTAAEIDSVRAALAELDEDQALQIEVEV